MLEELLNLVWHRKETALDSKKNYISFVITFQLMKLTTCSNLLDTRSLNPEDYCNEVTENELKIPEKQDIYMETFHISCKSSVFQTGKNYLGFILYQYEGENDWTLNRVHCKSGYIYLAEDKRLVVLPGGTQHQKAYYSLFGTSIPPEGKLVASGFAYQNGRWKQASGTFSSTETSFAVNTNREGVDEMDFIIAAVENWRKGGG